MSATEPQPVNSFLQLMPMARAFTTLHPTHQSSLSANSNSPDRCAESHTVRINNVSRMVKDMGGYFHGGLND
jgi:hypothetical protein